MVERLFRQHAVPRRLSPRPRVLYRRRRAHRADLWRTRPQQRACRRRQHRLEARARAAGEAEDSLLDSYSPERRGATLDVFANATKSTRFMTPPTRGWRLAREAALSLSLKHEFPRGLANPRQMQPYTYSESPLTPFANRDAEFASAPSAAALRRMPNSPTAAFCSIAPAIGMTALLFCEGAPDRRQAALLDQLGRLDKRFVALHLASACRGGDYRTPTARLPPVRGGTRHALSAAPRPAHRRPLEDHRAGRSPAHRAPLPGECRRHEPMPFDDLETAYEALATAIDTAGGSARRCS